MKLTLMIGGLALASVGAVIAANAAATLFAAGALSWLLLPVGGVEFFDTLLVPIAWLFGGGVIALIGLGLMVAAFNLRRGRQSPSSAEM
ncbi:MULTISPECIES: hypothetical protein [unclassified Microbacterium]|uniref:hypothetical protein n=1 Tax=unclassified Microbacterium TaxID=2609290 RepID=UPI00300FFD2E